MSWNAMPGAQRVAIARIPIGILLLLAMQHRRLFSGDGLALVSALTLGAAARLRFDRNARIGAVVDARSRGVTPNAAAIRPATTTARARVRLHVG